MKKYRPFQLRYRHYFMLHTGVSVQYAGQPFPSYKRNPHEFRKAFGTRPLYVTTTAPDYIAASFLNDADFIRGNNEILYRVTWKQQ